MRVLHHRPAERTHPAELHRLQRQGHTVQVCVAAPQSTARTSAQLSLAIPSLAGVKSVSQRAMTLMTLCSWRVKAGMVRVWVAGKTV